MATLRGENYNLEAGFVYTIQGTVPNQVLRAFSGVNQSISTTDTAEIAAIETTLNGGGRFIALEGNVWLNADFLQTLIETGPGVYKAIMQDGADTFEYPITAIDYAAINAIFNEATGPQIAGFPVDVPSLADGTVLGLVGGQFEGVSAGGGPPVGPSTANGTILVSDGAGGWSEYSELSAIFRTDATLIVSNSVDGMAETFQAIQGSNSLLSAQTNATSSGLWSGHASATALGPTGVTSGVRVGVSVLTLLNPAEIVAGSLPVAETGLFQAYYDADSGSGYAGIHMQDGSGNPAMVRASIQPNNTEPWTVAQCVSFGPTVGESGTNTTSGDASVSYMFAGLTANSPYNNETVIDGGGLDGAYVYVYYDGSGFNPNVVRLGVGDSFPLSFITIEEGTVGMGTGGGAQLSLTQQGVAISDTTMICTPADRLGFFGIIGLGQGATKQTYNTGAGADALAGLLEQYGLISVS